jgi:hypothetical protein
MRFDAPHRMTASGSSAMTRNIGFLLAFDHFLLQRAA